MPAIALYAMLAAAERAVQREEELRLRDRLIRDDDRRPERWPADDRRPAGRIVLALRAAVSLVPALGH